MTTTLQSAKALFKAMGVVLHRHGDVYHVRIKYADASTTYRTRDLADALAKAEELVRPAFTDAGRKNLDDES
jgi:hypothetical protein